MTGRFGAERQSSTKQTSAQEQKQQNQTVADTSAIIESEPTPCSETGFGTPVIGSAAGTGDLLAAERVIIRFLARRAVRHARRDIMTKIGSNEQE